VHQVFRVNQARLPVSDRLTIALVIHSLDGGGAERVIAGLASRLAARGHRVHLITYTDAASDRHEVDGAVERISLDLRGDASGLLGKVRQVKSRIRRLAQSLAKLDADVIVSFCDRNNIDVLMAAGRGETPVIACERSDPARQSLGWFWDSMRRHYYGHAAAVVALTENAARYLEPFCSNVVVIPSAVDVPPLESDRRFAAIQYTVAGVGRLEHEKGFDRLLHAFALATKNHSQWRLIIYGEGSQRDALTEMGKGLGMQHRLSLPGWVRPLWKPLSEATVFCLPSRYEGFPSALLEAMALGVPSISVDCESGPRVIIRHGFNGLLVEPSVHGLTEGLSRWIDDEAERERVGREGKTVVNEFGWEPMVERFEALMFEIAKQSH
jgi:glycosyltransferase involved in cell wall biosynthesis